MITSRPQQNSQAPMAESEENVEDYPMQSSSSRPVSHYTIPAATATTLDSPTASSPGACAGLGGGGGSLNGSSGNLHTPFVAITSPESRMEPPDANSVVFKIDQHRSETFEVTCTFSRQFSSCRAVA